MDLFESLPEEKKERILQVCIQEFAAHGYRDSSTNRIIRQADIAKGSLFKYFRSKEDLYFYILDYVAGQIMAELAPMIAQAPEDLLGRLVYLAQIELQLHLEKPLYFNLFRKAQEQDGTEVSDKIREKYGAGAEASARQMLRDISPDNLRYDKDITIDAVLWLLKGFNESFIAHLPEDVDIELVQRNYLSRLDAYLEIIRNGIYK